jgi:hypothetical protein
LQIVCLGILLAPHVLSAQGLLTRLVGSRPVSRDPNAIVDIQPYFTVGTSYTSNLGKLSTDLVGNLQTADSFGMGMSFGANGSHEWRRSAIDVNYRGNVRHYTSATSFDGIDQTLMLSFSHQLTRRTSFGVTQSGGLFSRPLGLVTPVESGFDTPIYQQTPQNELFDQRVVYLSTVGGFGHELTNRTSIQASSGVFSTQRQGDQLTDTLGYGAGGGITRELGRRTTIGVNYQYAHFEFKQQFGGSDAHVVLATIARTMGRRWTLSASGGMYRVESLFIQTITLDPFIALILGRSTGQEASYRDTRGVSANASLSRAFRRSTLSFGYTRGVVPGNGFYLTSQGESFLVSYGYSGRNRVSLSMYGSHTRFKSVSQDDVGTFAGSSAGMNSGLRLVGPIFLSGGAFVQRIEAGLTGYHRNTYSVSVGLTYNPSTLPLRFR